MNRSLRDVVRPGPVVAGLAVLLIVVLAGCGARGAGYRPRQWPGFAPIGRLLQTASIRAKKSVKSSGTQPKDHAC